MSIRESSASGESAASGPNVGLLEDERTAGLAGEGQLVIGDGVTRGVRQAREVLVTERAFWARGEGHRTGRDGDPAGRRRRVLAGCLVAVDLRAERAVGLELDRVVGLVGFGHDALE